MKSFARQLRNEEGSVIVVALMILVVLTIIGISATDTTKVELQIATNDKFHKIAFYNADAGVYATPKLISAHLDDTTSLIVIPGVNYLPIGDPSNFDRQIKGFDSYDGGTKDIRIVLGGNNWEEAEVDGTYPCFKSSISSSAVSKVLTRPALTSSLASLSASCHSFVQK